MTPSHGSGSAVRERIGKLVGVGLGNEACRIDSKHEPGGAASPSVRTLALGSAMRSMCWRWLLLLAVACAERDEKNAATVQPQAEVAAPRPETSPAPSDPVAIAT